METVSKTKPKDISDVVSQGGAFVPKGEPVEPPPDPNAIDLEVAAPLVAAFADSAAEELGRRIKGLEPSIPTPYEGLTKLLVGGFREGFYVLVGNTKTGKTQMAVEMAVKAAQAGHPVLYASLESARKYIYARMLSALDGKPWTWLTREAEDKQYEETNLTRLNDSEEAKRLRGLPIRVSDGVWSDQTTLKTARLMKEKHPGKAPFIVVDYLQRVSRETGKAEEIRTAIGKVTGIAALAAKETGASVLLISSTARNHYERLAGRDGSFKVSKADPAELLGTGKESGDIEFDAHATLVLCTTQDEVKSENWQDKRHWLAVAGARDSEIGWAGPFAFHNGAVFNEIEASKQTDKGAKSENDSFDYSE